MKNSVESNVVKVGKKSTGTVLKNRTITARNEAEKILTEARRSAAEIEASSKVACAAEHKRAYEAGREEAIGELASKLIRAAEIEDGALRNAESSLLDLSVKLAEKLVGRELDANRAVVIDIVQNALQHARQQKSLTLRVNPADAAIVQSEIEKLKASAQTKFVDIVSDPRVDEGGCLIESEVGTVDARLETQFRVLRKALHARSEGEAGTDSL